MPVSQSLVAWFLKHFHDYNVDFGLPFWTSKPHSIPIFDSCSSFLLHNSTYFVVFEAFSRTGSRHLGFSAAILSRETSSNTDFRLLLVMAVPQKAAVLNFGPPSWTLFHHLASPHFIAYRFSTCIRPARSTDTRIALFLKHFYDQKATILDFGPQRWILKLR